MWSTQTLSRPSSQGYIPAFAEQVETQTIGRTLEHMNPHTSVMLEEALYFLNPQDGEIYLDATFGAGGHTRAILEKAPGCKVVGIDRDPHVKHWMEVLPKNSASRLTLLQGEFANMEELLKQAGINKVHGILLDIGVSSMQLDTPRRGFSFSHDGPLDMRMSDMGETAAELIARIDEETLANLIFRLSNEKNSRRIARAIDNAKRIEPITRTRQLSEIVASVVRGYNGGIHPATRTFQALRMVVNQELEQLEAALSAAERMLYPNGRLVVITFHSEEDRLVKQFINNRIGKVGGYSRYQPVPNPQELKCEPTFSALTKKALAPSDEEVAKNTRARSAKLRAALRTYAEITHNDSRS